MYYNRSYVNVAFLPLKISYYTQLTFPLKGSTDCFSLAYPNCQHQGNY